MENDENLRQKSKKKSTNLKPTYKVPKKTITDFIFRTDQCKRSKITKIILILTNNFLRGVQTPLYPA